jgi:hypothetical protein
MCNVNSGKYTTHFDDKRLYQEYLDQHDEKYHKFDYRYHLDYQLVHILKVPIQPHSSHDKVAFLLRHILETFFLSIVIPSS